MEHDKGEVHELFPKEEDFTPVEALLSDEHGITEELYGVLREQHTKRVIEADLGQLLAYVKADWISLGYGPRVDLGRVHPDSSEIVQTNPGSGQTPEYVPGLIGLEAFDKANDLKDVSLPVLRLYMGTSFANLALTARYHTDPDFKDDVDRQFRFGKHRTRSVNQDDQQGWEASIGSEPEALKQSIRRMAATLAIHVMFDDETAIKMYHVLRNNFDKQYNQAVLDNITPNIRAVGVTVPQMFVDDRFPKEAYASRRLLPAPVVLSLLQGSTSGLNVLE